MTDRSVVAADDGDLSLAGAALDWLVSSRSAEDVALLTGRTPEDLRALSDRFAAFRTGGPRPAAPEAPHEVRHAVAAVRDRVGELGLEAASTSVGAVSAVVRFRRGESAGADTWLAVTVDASGRSLVLRADLAVHHRRIEETLRPLLGPPGALGPEPTARASLLDLIPKREDPGRRLSAPGDDAGTRALFDDLTRYGLPWCAALADSESVLAHLRGLRYPDRHDERRLAVAEILAGEPDRAADALRGHTAWAGRLPAGPGARVAAFLARFDARAGTVAAPVVPAVSPPAGADTRVAVPGRADPLPLAATDARAAADALGIATLESDLEFEAWIGPSKAHAHDLATRLSG